MERATVLLVLAVLAVYLSTCSAQRCNLYSYASRGDCSFYRCLESQKFCGSGGYAIGYGYKYCTRFSTYISYFNSAGRQWVTNVRRCLMYSLARYNPAGRSCSQIRTYAFNSHPGCYLRSSPGFCKIAFSNWRGLYKVLDLGDFFSREALQQVYQTLKGCFRGKRDKESQEIMAAFEKVLLR